MSIAQLMKEAYHIMDSSPADIHPQNMLDDFTPLTKGQYPIFNKYPKFIVDYQVCMLILSLAHLINQYCFAHWRLLSSSVTLQAGRACGQPTLHGGPVRLRPIRATPC